MYEILIFSFCQMSVFKDIWQQELKSKSTSYSVKQVNKFSKDEINFVLFLVPQFEFTSSSSQLKHALRK